MLMAVVLLAKHARWTMPNKATGQLHASPFAAGIIEKVPKIHVEANETRQNETTEFVSHG